MRHIKTPADLRQWRKEHNGLTHIGQYKRMESNPYADWYEIRSKIKRSSIGWPMAPASYAEVERDEFLGDGK